MGDGDLSALHRHLLCKTKKNYQGGLNDTSNATVMWLISSVHPVKTGLETVSSLTTSIAAVKKGKKKDRQRKYSAYRREFRNTGLGNCFWGIGDNRIKYCFHKLIRKNFKLR